MGYTNKTSHYELPQYVANDKPSWLGDFNAAMLKIDTAMADNDATAEAANSAATGAQTQVAALSAQLSTIQGQVNTAVDTATTADGKATTAQSVATQASTTAGEAKTLAETAKQSADLALPISGGTMTGNLILNGTPTADNQAATKAYVDSHAGDVVSWATADKNDTNVSQGTAYLRAGSKLVFGSFRATMQARTDFVAGTNGYIIFKIAGNPLNLPATSSITNRLVCGMATKISSSTVTYLPIYLLSDGTDTYLCGVGNAWVSGDVIFGNVMYKGVA